MAIEHGEYRQGQPGDAPITTASGEQQSTEQARNEPRLHPIWERVADVLAKQGVKKRPARTQPAASREQFLEKFKQQREAKAAEMRDRRNRMKERRQRQETSLYPHPSATPPVSENPLPIRSRQTSAPKKP
jgi:hypothetical protein